MLNNEVLNTIIEKRRSYKLFTQQKISDEALDTILMCGKTAPTGMNKQPWHFTVIKTPETMEEFGKDLIEAGSKIFSGKAPGGPGGPPPLRGPDISTPAGRTRNAPVMIIVSGDNKEMCAPVDCLLAMENIIIGAASMGIGSGWDFFVNKDFFEGPDGDKYKEKYKIPEGYTVFCACYFGYPDKAQPERDRGPRKDGTITIL